MDRMVAETDQVRERRNHVRRTSYTALELLATEPNQLWNWDITKLRGPEKWSYYYLYVILDVFSRAVVGSLIAEREMTPYQTTSVISCDRGRRTSFMLPLRKPCKSSVT
jgi:putative transposase